MKSNQALWSKQLQTSPPDFGKAKFLPRWLFKLIYKKRQVRNKPIILDSKINPTFIKDKISIVILSCKRLKELRRLIDTLKEYFSKIKPKVDLEIILVDNGSGSDLINWAKKEVFFDKIIANKKNLGMAVALKEAYEKTNGEYILLIEDDFIIDYEKPFLENCIEIFNEFYDIGIIRLKNQRNWGKRYRLIGPKRSTSNGTNFWTWIPSFNGKLNVWCAGSVMFRKVSLTSSGEIPIGPNFPRTNKMHQGVLYEEEFGKQYNKNWLAAKIEDCYPFIQPNDNAESPGWGD